MITLIIAIICFSAGTVFSEINGIRKEQKKDNKKIAEAKKKLPMAVIRGKQFSSQ